MKNMNKLFIFLVLAAAFVFAGQANAQTRIVFAKGASSKTLTVTVPANGEKSFSVQVKEGQVINIGVSGDINVSKTTEFPVISVNLTNGEEGVDNSQDGEGYLSILAGRSGNYVFSVANSDKKRARTFKMEVKVTNDRADFAGGEEVEQ
ncbi:MAG: hypothetical protein LUM44_23705 [Pyrinomonadaceae bacterium]|nr:hypothetical protein [Pyrinomonadaceae bacterium]